ncbi:MAG: hypothetical protein ACOH1T_02155 [Microbacteriaceae bacterium]
MSNLPSVNSDDMTEPRKGPRSGGVLAFVAILGLETVALVAATIFLIFEILVADPRSLSSAIALTVVVALAAVWVAAITLGAWRGRSWTRGASIVVQILLASMAIGSFQGLLPRPDIGWILLVPALAVMVLLFGKPVQAWLAR